MSEIRCHGTWSCYTGGCRCDDCTHAAKTYRRDRRRAAGLSDGGRASGSADYGYMLNPLALGHQPAFFSDPDRACAGKPTSLFFPERGWHADAARAVCAECPFVGECAEWGVDHERHGVYGGLTERDRERIRIKRGERSA